MPGYTDLNCVCVLLYCVSLMWLIWCDFLFLFSSSFFLYNFWTEFSLHSSPTAVRNRLCSGSSSKLPWGEVVDLTDRVLHWLTGNSQSRQLLKKLCVEPARPLGKLRVSRFPNPISMPAEQADTCSSCPCRSTRMWEFQQESRTVTSLCTFAHLFLSFLLSTAS